MAQKVFKSPLEQAQSYAPTWEGKDYDDVSELINRLDFDYGIPVDVEDLEEDDETYTIADVIRPHARAMKIPLNRAIELFTKNSGLSGKNTWGDWVRFNSKNK